MTEKGYNRIIFQPVARKQLFEMRPKVLLTDILVKFGLSSNTAKKPEEIQAKRIQDDSESESEQLYSCHLCKVKKMDQKAISKHIHFTHGSSCSLCGKQYIRSKAFKLIQHWKRKHDSTKTSNSAQQSSEESGNSKAISVKKPESAEKQVFTCVECSLTFESLSEITKHMLAGHKDRKHKSIDTASTPTKRKKLDHRSKGVAVVSLPLPQDWDTESEEQESIVTGEESSDSTDPLVNLKFLINAVQAAPSLDTDSGGATAGVIAYDCIEKFDNQMPKIKESRGHEHLWEELKERAQGEKMSKAPTSPYPQKVKSKSSTTSAKENPSKATEQSTDSPKSVPVPISVQSEEPLKSVPVSVQSTEPLKSNPIPTSIESTGPQNTAPFSIPASVQSTGPFKWTPVPRSVIKSTNWYPDTGHPSNTTGTKVAGPKPARKTAINDQLAALNKLAVNVPDKPNNSTNTSSTTVLASTKSMATKSHIIRKIQTNALKKQKMVSSADIASQSAVSEASNSMKLNLSLKTGTKSYATSKNTNYPALELVASGCFDSVGVFNLKQRPDKDIPTPIAKGTQDLPVIIPSMVQEINQLGRRHASATHHPFTLNALTDSGNHTNALNSTSIRTVPTPQQYTQTSQPTGMLLGNSTQPFPSHNQPFHTSSSLTHQPASSQVCNQPNSSSFQKLASDQALNLTGRNASHRSTGNQAHSSTSSQIHNSTGNLVQNSTVIQSDSSTDALSSSHTSSSEHPGAPRLLKRITPTIWRCKSCNVNLSRTETKAHLLNLHQDYLRARLLYIKQQTQTKQTQQPQTPPPLKQMQLTCTFCGVYTTPDSSLLANHIVAAHKSTFIRKCEFCDYESLFSSNLQRHVDAHHKWRFCDMCHFQTRNHVLLIDHVSVVHLGLVD